MHSKRLGLLLGLLLGWATPAWATVAFDAYTSSGSGSDTLSWTHSPVGTPGGVLIVCMGGSNADGFADATYGGSTVSEVTGSPVTVAGENGNVSAFFLGSSILTGDQTVSVTVNDSSTKQCGAYTLTADANTEVVDSDGTISSTSLENPAVTLSLAGRTSFAAIVFYTGQGDPANYAPLTNWTARLEFDLGSDGSGTYSYDTIGSTDVTAGWTQGADDAGMVAVAISEVVGTARRVWMLEDR